MKEHEIIGDIYSRYVYGPNGELLMPLMIFGWTETECREDQEIQSYLQKQPREVMTLNSNVNELINQKSLSE